MFFYNPPQMHILDTVFEKLGSGLDHVGSALDGLVSSHISATDQTPMPTENPMVANVLSALAHNETRGVKGDPYAFSQPSGDPAMGQAMGKYQVTEGELKTWGKDFMGAPVDPKQFQADPALQETYMKKKTEALIKAGATPEQIFAMHRGGLTGYADPAVRAKKVLQRQGYVDNAMAFMNSLGDNKTN